MLRVARLHQHQAVVDFTASDAISGADLHIQPDRLFILIGGIFYIRHAQKRVCLAMCFADFPKERQGILI